MDTLYTVLHTVRAFIKVFRICPIDYPFQTLNVKSYTTYFPLLLFHDIIKILSPPRAKAKRGNRQTEELL